MTGPPPLPTTKALLKKHRCLCAPGVIAWSVSVFSHGLNWESLVDAMVDEAWEHIYQGQADTPHRDDLVFTQEARRVVIRRRLYRIEEIVP